MSGQLSESAARPFTALQPQPADALLGLIALHQQDLRPHKIDVGLGVYRDEHGRTPVMRSVKVAERLLVAQQMTKAYLGAEGDARFAQLLGELVLGETLSRSEDVIGLQTPGGTGALRLGAELLGRAELGRQIWLGNPTWPNHAPVMVEAGLRPRPYPYFNKESGSVDFGMMIEALGRAVPGDIVLLHGCCHNPTGADLSQAQWRELGDLCNTHGLVPFVDVAYQGLGDGLDEDIAGLRILLERVEAALIAYSCNKNFGLYRDRVGALWVRVNTQATSGVVRDNLHSLARSLWSMPPDHGAAIVRIILDDAGLRADWHTELGEMRARLNRIRTRLATAHSMFKQIGSQKGLFSMLPINADFVAALRSEHAIYMAGNGRVNLAGLSETSLGRFSAAVVQYLGTA